MSLSRSRWSLLASFPDSPFPVPAPSAGVTETLGVGMSVGAIEAAVDGTARDGNDEGGGGPGGGA